MTANKRKQKWYADEQKVVAIGHILIAIVCAIGDFGLYYLLPRLLNSGA